MIMLRGYLVVSVLLLIVNAPGRGFQYPPDMVCSLVDMVGSLVVGVDGRAAPERDVLGVFGGIA
jgi:hypothetical protein